MISKLPVRCSNDGATDPLQKQPQSGAAASAASVVGDLVDSTEPPQKQPQSGAAAAATSVVGDDGADPTEPPQKQRKLSTLFSADLPAREKAGCQWTGTLEQLDEHLKACAFVRVRCGLPGCRTKVLKHELLAHELNCEFRKIACAACQKEVVARNVQVHLERNCPERQVECEYCKSTMTANALGKQPTRGRFGSLHMRDDRYRSAWTGHLAECTHAKVRCEFWSIGCCNDIKRCDLAAHHAANASKHASLTVKKFATVEQAMERQLKTLREELQWEEMGMSWRISMEKFAGTSQKVIKSTGPLTAGNKMRLRVDVGEGREGRIKVSLCTELAPWSPVRVLRVNIGIEQPSDTWLEDLHRGTPSFYVQAANLHAPDYSCGGDLEYETIEMPDSDNDSDSENEITAHLTRADLNDISVAGFIKLRATFKVKKLSSVNVKTVN